MNFLPNSKSTYLHRTYTLGNFQYSSQFRKTPYFIGILIDLICIAIIFLYTFISNHAIYNFVISPLSSIKPLTNTKNQHEVFGFAPYWTIDKLDNVDFSILTTVAYFGISVDHEGNLIEDTGYSSFHSQQAAELFKKAHLHGTRVVLTLMQMENNSIVNFLDNPQAQVSAIEQAVGQVKNRGIDGINVDFEYNGNPGFQYQEKFSMFVKNLTRRMHEVIPFSKVTVSVYAASAKDPKLYNIEQLSQVSDGIFMMAYDFSTPASDTAIPTAPLYGYKEGKYWYDIATAVEDFLKLMPSHKLILGLPWYGYNFAVYQPEVKSETLPYYWWAGQSVAQTYTDGKDAITPDMPGISDYKSGWDIHGQVGWKAYFLANTQTWRMVFLDDAKSLQIKYDFAKNKNLAGVGIWALGFDEGKNELWNVLRQIFGPKIADNRVSQKEIYENTY